MRFFPRYLLFVLLLVTSPFVPTPAALAQLRPPEPKLAAEALPSAPEPHNGFSSADPADEAPIAAQSQSKPGTPAAQNNNAQPASAADPSSASIHGTVFDVYGDLIPEAPLVLEGPAPSDRQTGVADDNAGFSFSHLKPGVTYYLTIDTPGFESWKSPPLVLSPGQYLIMQGIKLKVQDAGSSVTVYASQEQIATQQVIVEEHQRIFGIIPNFYVTYDKNPVPLTTKLKFRLAFKADTDIMTFVGVAFISAIYQAGDIPDYGQGWDAFGKRMAAGYADTTTDIYFGGAIYPWLLRQDPRYFYQGTGTKKSRLRHAVFSPFVCKGDNGKTQLNYSSMGGDLTSGAISNLYYPQSDRGVGLLFQGFAITTGVRMVNGLLQEFVIRKLTPTARATAAQN
jgi:hypothetical protein